MKRVFAGASENKLVHVSADKFGYTTRVMYSGDVELVAPIAVRHGHDPTVPFVPSVTDEICFVVKNTTRTNDPNELLCTRIPPMGDPQGPVYSVMVHPGHAIANGPLSFAGRALYTSNVAEGTSDNYYPEDRLMLYLGRQAPTPAVVPPARDDLAGPRDMPASPFVARMDSEASSQAVTGFHPSSPLLRVEIQLANSTNLPSMWSAANV